MLRVGEIVADRYRLLGHLGDGGSASVWKAEDRTLEREVAIKFLYAQDERFKAELEEQFLREARLACAVKHRNVIQTVDFGRTEEGQAYMVMELLQGDDLGERMGDGPLMAIEQTVDVVAQTLRGLSAVHEAGIVHRDVKPENIYLENDGQGLYPKILDFGIAKSVDKRSGRRSVLTTKEGVVVGTPEYMSPEQARGMPGIDVRSDVWSVGVILFELLTGKLPFDHPYSGELIIQICTTDAPQVIDLRPEVGVAISNVVAKALTRDREQRFQTAQEMLDALLAATERGVAPVISSRPAPAGAPERGRATVVWTSALVAVAVVTVAVVFLPEGDASRGLVVPRRLERPLPERATVTVELRGVPEGAIVTVNGRPARGGTLTLPNDNHARLIEVQAARRATWRVMHPAGNDATYEVRMPGANAQPDAAVLGATARATTAAPAEAGAIVAKAPTSEPAPPIAPANPIPSPPTPIAPEAAIHPPIAPPAARTLRAPRSVTAPLKAAKPTAPAAVPTPAASAPAPAAGDDEEQKEIPLPKPEVWRKADF